MRVIIAVNDEMNVTGFSADNNDTFAGNQSVEQFDEIVTPFHRGSEIKGEVPWLDWKTADAVRDIILYVAYGLGIPGNILSAIVWLRRHVASENPSAIYLAALAINDLVFLLFDGLCQLVCSPTGCYACTDTWFCCFLGSSTWSTSCLGSLLVLGFSVVRLIAIRQPLQVRTLHHD